MAVNNHWWVGLNVGSDQSTILGTSSLLSPSGYESLPSGSVADDALFMAAAVKDKGSSSPTTITVEGVQWFNIQGPYATQAQANAAIPAIQKANPAPGAASQLVDVATGQSQSTNSVSDPLNYLADVGDFFHRLTEAATWERVGEVAAGLVLLYIGMKALTQSTNAGQAVKKSSHKLRKAIEIAAVPK